MDDDEVIIDIDGVPVVDEIVEEEEPIGEPPPEEDIEFILHN